MLVEHRRVWIAGGVFLLACIFLVLVCRQTRTPLVIISSDPSIKVPSVIATFGTNHVYYHGDSMDRLMDTLITRFSDTNANRLSCSTMEESTVVWIRFDHPDYGVTPPPGRLVAPPATFSAQLLDSDGTTIPLQPVNTRMQSYRRKFLVMGWEVQGHLDVHQGSTIRIETTNGTAAVTFKVL